MVYYFRGHPYGIWSMVSIVYITPIIIGAYITDFPTGNVGFSSKNKKRPARQSVEFFLCNDLGIVQKVGHLQFAVFGYRHLQVGSGIFNLGASGSVGGKLHFVGVNFHFGSKIGVAQPTGEAPGNGFHKSGNGGGSRGVGSDFGNEDFSVFNGFLLVVEGFEGMK